MRKVNGKRKKERVDTEIELKEKIGERQKQL